MTPEEFIAEVRKILNQYDEGAVFDHEAAVAIISRGTEVKLPFAMWEQMEIDAKAKQN